MNQDDHDRRVRELFDEALALGASARSSFLETACDGDLRLRQRVEQLLTQCSRAEAEDFLLPMTAHEDGLPRVESRRQEKGESTAEVAPLNGHDSSESRGIDDLALSGEGSVGFPERFGRYKVLKKLGEGGMGAVYLAHDTELDRQVALKVPFLRAFDNVALIQRFQREARSAAKLNHPNLCPVYDVGEIDGVPYLTMPHLHGTPLSVRVHTQRPWAIREAASLVRKIALAMAEAHRYGIVHRDLKLANIMIDQSGEPIVLDFGLARSLESEGTLTAPGVIVGTPYCLAPEQIERDGNAHSPAVDIYGLGVVLYQLVTGRRPFEGSVPSVLAQITSSPVPDPRQFRPDLDPRLESILLKALARNPADRFPSMAAFSAALTDIAEVSAMSLPSQGGTNAESASVSLGEPVRVDASSVLAVRPGKLARQQPLSPPWRRLLLAALGAAASVLLSAILYITTDRGTLEIRALDEDVKVSISDDGQVVALLDTKTGRTIRLRSGRYELKLDPARDGLMMSTDSFVLKRGDRVIVEVRRVISPTTGTRTGVANPAPTGSSPPPGRSSMAIPVNGLGGLRAIEPVEYPQAWKAPGVLARIKGLGELRYPPVPVSDYVMEMELTFSSPIEKGDKVNVWLANLTGGSLNLSLGRDEWDGEREPDLARIPCSMIGCFPSWVRQDQEDMFVHEGELSFPADQRLSLKLVAVDAERALYCNGARVLGGRAFPADLQLSILSRNTSDFVIHSCSFREVRLDELEALGWTRAQRRNSWNVEVAGRRISEQSVGLDKLPRPEHAFLVDRIAAPMRWLSAGEFEMGSDCGFPTWGGTNAWGKGKHMVRLTRGFWMSQYEVTQGQWGKLLDFNPSRIKGSPHLPVNWISRNEAQALCDRLTQLERKAGRVPDGFAYRLPTEAEWEYACRTGMDAADVARRPFWVSENSHNDLHEVGEWPPNRWGLYDMLGNVDEWCWDAFQEYPAQAPGVLVDPFKLVQGENATFALRGGAWWYWQADLKSGDKILATLIDRRVRSLSLATGYHGFRFVLGPDYSRSAEKLGPGLLAGDRTSLGTAQGRADAPASTAAIEPVFHLDLSQDRVFETTEMVQRGYKNNIYYWESRFDGNGVGETLFTDYSDGVVEVRAREASGYRGGWYVALRNYRFGSLQAAVVVTPDQAVGIWLKPAEYIHGNTMVDLPLIHDQAIHPPGEWNLLRIVVAGKKLSVLINGKLIMGPYRMAVDVAPGTVSLGSQNGYGKARVEFSRLVVWPTTDIKKLPPGD